MKRFFTLLLITASMAIIGYLFWFEELRFSQPTPLPAQHEEVLAGEVLAPRVLETLPNPKNKNLFVHFYNYDCPCSRFNAKEFRNLVMKYRDQVEFVAVLEAGPDRNSKNLEAFDQKYGLGIPLVLDKDGSIAKAMGIYSTPQAVILKGDQIYFKGNYNAARFCTAKNTRFAELALQALVKHQKAPSFPDLAFIAYGCELPANGNTLSRLEKIFNF